jgi:hypothetical protein
VLIVDDTGFLKKGHPLGRRAAPVLGHRRAGGELPLGSGCSSRTRVRPGTR